MEYNPAKDVTAAGGYCTKSKRGTFFSFFILRHILIRRRGALTLAGLQRAWGSGISSIQSFCLSYPSFNGAMILPNAYDMLHVR